MKQYAIEQIADWFLYQSNKISPKKLQKLCYYTQAWACALLDEDKGVSDTVFEAWAHGPVASCLYQKYKHLGWKHIPQASSHEIDDEQVLELLQSVWATYGDKSGNELEVLSHGEMPWIAARERAGVREGERCSEPIWPSDMHEFYLSIYNGN